MHIGILRPGEKTSGKKMVKRITNTAYNSWSFYAVENTFKT